jgi:hypothetical protein
MNLPDIGAVCASSPEQAAGGAGRERQFDLLDGPGAVVLD